MLARLRSKPCVRTLPPSAHRSSTGRRRARERASRWSWRTSTATTCPTCCACGRWCPSLWAQSAPSRPGCRWAQRARWCTWARASRASSRTRSAVSGAASLLRCCRRCPGARPGSALAHAPPPAACRPCRLATPRAARSGIRPRQPQPPRGRPNRPRPQPCPAACLRTGQWLSCFGRRRLKTHEQQMLEKMKVLDDIVSDAGAQGVIWVGRGPRPSLGVRDCSGPTARPASAAPRDHARPPHCPQTTASLSARAPRRASARRSALLWAACSLQWRRPAASGAGGWGWAGGG